MVVDATGHSAGGAEARTGAAELGAEADAAFGAGPSEHGPVETKLMMTQQ